MYNWFHLILYLAYIIKKNFFDTIVRPLMSGDFSDFLLENILKLLFFLLFFHQFLI